MMIKIQWIPTAFDQGLHSTDDAESIKERRWWLAEKTSAKAPPSRLEMTMRLKGFI